MLYIYIQYIFNNTVIIFV